MIDRLLRSARKQPEEKPAPEVIIAGGDYISHGSITITEAVTGDLYALNRVLVEADGSVKGNIFSTEAEIRGLVQGDILCRGCLMIRTSGVITGRIVAQSIEIDAGAVVNGSIALEEPVHVQMLLEKVKQAARKENEIDSSEAKFETGPVPPVRSLLNGGSGSVSKPTNAGTAGSDTEGWW